MTYINYLLLNNKKICENVFAKTKKTAIYIFDNNMLRMFIYFYEYACVLFIFKHNVKLFIYYHI